MEESPPFRPAPSADDLARQLVDARDVHRDILSETITSLENGQMMESGRTVCGPNGTPQGPLARFPAAVELGSCPVETTGVWHTHVTSDQLRDPEHSLPDIANVAFGEADASMVVGTNSGEVVVQASDTKAMQDAFEDILGVDVESPQDVAAARERGEIEDISDVHHRLRSRFEGLIWRVHTGYNGLEARLSTTDDAAAEAMQAWNCSLYDHEDHGEAAEPVEAQHRPFRDGQPDAGRLRERARMSTHMFRSRYEQGGISIAQIAAGQIVGTIVGRLTERVVFK